MSEKMKFKCQNCGYEIIEEVSICPQCTSELNESTLSKVKGIFNNMGEFVSLKSKEVLDSNPRVTKHAQNISDAVSSKYEESGAKKHIHTIKTTSGEKLDVISGQAMYELVQERLDIQDRYNDLLATKLQEALERIKELEEELSELNSTKDN